jgi:endo-1,4-beta-xylanase
LEPWARELNMVEPEEAMKWRTVRRNPGTFDPRVAMKLYFAQADALKVRGHCLAWNHNHPKWLTTGHFTPIQLFHLL